MQRDLDQGNQDDQLGPNQTLSRRHPEIREVQTAGPDEVSQQICPLPGVDRFCRGVRSPGQQVGCPLSGSRIGRTRWGEEVGRTSHAVQQ